MKQLNPRYSIPAITLLCCFLFISLNSPGQALLPKEFRDKLKKENGVLLDVRTPEEFSAEYISGAVNIDVRAGDFNSRIDSLDKNKTYFLYCKSGKRSEEAYKLMKEKGFKNLAQLKGGIEEWKLDGNKVMRGK